MFSPIKYEKNKLYVLDQVLLPNHEKWIECENFEIVIECIKNMNVRGAPLIGIVAAFGIAIGIRNSKISDYSELESFFEFLCKDFASSRPTAVNLFWSIDRMKNLFRSLLQKKTQIDEIKSILINEAQKILSEDIEINKTIGKYGNEIIKENYTVLTHCNAGALATGGYGTALGVIRAAHESGKNIKVLVDETRPLLQGARLTAWELLKDDIDVTLITDNMAGYYMKKGLIDVVITGADRIALNGDSANKIGTYSVAVLAHSHSIPFYIAAPISTFDFNCPNGDHIPIEERKHVEVTSIYEVQIAPTNINVFNPAFDVTPAKYITGIITEKGIVTPNQVKGLKDKHE